MRHGLCSPSIAIPASCLAPVPHYPGYVTNPRTNTCLSDRAEQRGLDIRIIPYRTHLILCTNLCTGKTVYLICWAGSLSLILSSPVSKSFPNRSVGKKPSHRPLTVNTIILHIQMRITPRLYLFLSLVTLTSFISGLVDFVSFSKNQATHPLALQHYILRYSIL